MSEAHLTTVQREGESAHPWRASCLCGWSADRRLKREAVAVAVAHWFSMPLGTGEPDQPKGAS